MHVVVPALEQWERRQLGVFDHACVCGHRGLAVVTLRWRVRYLIVWPVKAGLVATEWWCAACRVPTLSGNTMGAAPPWLHRHGGFILIMAALVIGALVFYGAAAPRGGGTPAAPGGAARARFDTLSLKAYDLKASCEGALSRLRDRVLTRPLAELPLLRSQPMADLTGVRMVHASGNIMPWGFRSREGCPLDYQSPEGFSEFPTERVEPLITKLRAEMAALVQPTQVLVVDESVHDSTYFYRVALLAEPDQLLAVMQVEFAKPPSLDEFVRALAAPPTPPAAPKPPRKRR